MRHSPRGWVNRLLVIPAIAIVVSACGASATPATGTPTATIPASASTAPATVAPSASAASPSTAGSSSSAAPSASESQPPDTGGGTTTGDVPDNAVFLRYHGTNPSFSIQYVEGWQVRQQADGVIVHDKDSSETVAILAAQGDVQGYVSSTDLPSLQAQAGFKLIKQDMVKVGGTSYVHLAYHLPAPPDPVTGKRVASTVDRYYVPGPNNLAIVTLSTPDGVDNVDAFRQMIESFKWS
jgi:hypothetical protein